LQKIVLKKLTKKSRNKSKTDFSRFFYRVLGRFSLRGIQEHDKKYRKNLTGPSTLFASEEPANHVKARQSFLRAPCRGKIAGLAVV
jgi:hypothetical protein